MNDLGIVKPGTTLFIPFATFASTGASVTITGLATTDIEVYAGTSMTQRASDNGYALVDTDGIDLDGITGIQGISIDLADNSDAGFYGAGKRITVIVASITCDSQTINFIPVTFTIGQPAAVLNTTIATLSSQTSFTLTAGPAEDDALNGCIVCIHDVASAVQMGFGVVQDYTGASKTVTLTAGVTFTAAATDNISFFPPSNAQYGGTVAYSTTRGLAGTALPAAAADAAGGLIISDAGGLDADAQRADVAAILVDTGTTLDGRIPAALGANGNMKCDVRDFNGTAGTFSSGRPEVNTSHWAGSATATDDLALVTAPANFASLLVGSDGTLRANILHTGTAQAGAATTITLASGASSSDNYYKHSTVRIVSGTGAGQARLITSYVGSTRVATIESGHNWVTTPDNTSVYDVIADSSKDIQSWAGQAVLLTTFGGSYTLPHVYANLISIRDGTQSATDLKDFADDGYDPSTNKVQGVVLTDTLTTYTGNTPQTGDSYAIVNSGTHGNAAIKGYVDDIGVAGAGLTDLGGMSTTMKAQVNTEVLDVLNVDTFAEPGQEAPAATNTLVKKIGYLFKAWRNKKTKTATASNLYADDGTTIDQKTTDSDDGTTGTRGEVGSGP